MTPAELKQTERGLIILAICGLIGVALIWFMTRDLEPSTVNGVPASSKE